MNSPVDDNSGANNDCKTNVDHSGDGDGDGDGTEIISKKDEHNTTTTSKSVRVVSVSTSMSSDDSANDNPDKAHSVECGDGVGDFDADALYHIVDYLSTMDLYALGNTNQYLSHFLFHLPQTESIFRPYGRQYLQFCRNFKHSVLDAVPAIQKEKEQRKRQEQKLKNKNKNKKNPQKRKRGGKKLTDDEEKEAAAEQHNQCNPLNRLEIFPTDEEDAILIEKTRDGYFGMDLIRPDVVAVSGDYSGIFLTPNIESFLPSVQQSTSSSTIASASTPHSTSTSTIKEIPAAVAPTPTPTPTPTVVDANKEGATDPTINAAAAAEATATDPATDPVVKTKTRLTAITSKEDGSGYLFGDSLQVMAVLCAKNINRKPYVYLGFASGKIYSIDSNPIQRYGAASGSKASASNKASRSSSSRSSSNVEYPHVSECCYHFPNEISSLCSIDSKHVASSCVKPPRTPVDDPFATTLQEVLIHWNALVDGNLQRISKIDISQQMDVSSPLSMSSSSFCCDWNTYDSTSTTQPKTFLSIGSSNQLLTTVWWDTHTINALIDSKYKNTDTDNNDKPLPPPKNMQQYMNIQLQSDELTTFSLARDITAPSSSRSLRLPRYESFWTYLQERSKPSRNVHHFVFMKYFTNDHTQLVIGTSKGDLIKVETNPRPEQEGDRPHLRLAYSNETARDRIQYANGSTWFGRNKAQQVDYERHHLIYNCCRGGMVESVEVVGHNNNNNNRSSSSSSSSKVRWFDRNNNNNNTSNSTTTGSSINSPIMVTAGGRDGKIRFWDWNTFAPLGYLNIHPGRWTAPTTTPPLSLANMEAIAAVAAATIPGGGGTQQQQQKRMYHSPVVATFFCKERSTLISLCRDGHVHEWNVEEVYRKYKEATAINDETTTKEGGATTTAVVSESK